MSLLPRQSDAELLQLAAERSARVNGVTLGPASPLRSKQAGGRPTKATLSRDRDARRKEHDIQVALFAKIDNPANQRRWPELALCFAIPNGGYRTARTAGMLQAEGVRPGIPDVLCPAAHGGYHGFALELKRPGGSTSPAQSHWMAALARAGWKVALHTHEDAAFEEIVAYLEVTPTQRRVYGYLSTELDFHEQRILVSEQSSFFAPEIPSSEFIASALELCRTGYLVGGCAVDGRSLWLLLAYYSPLQLADVPPVAIRVPAASSRRRVIAWRVGSNRQRARRRGVTSHHTTVDILRILDAQHGRCFYCGAELGQDFHIEHMVPLSRGGSNAAGNICCACGPCNIRKGTKTATEFGASERR